MREESCFFMWANPGIIAPMALSTKVKTILHRANYCTYHANGLTTPIRLDKKTVRTGHVRGTQERYLGYQRTTANKGPDNNGKDPPLRMPQENREDTV